MKKIMVALGLILLPVMALAQAAAVAVAPYQPPQWIQDVMNWLQALPKVGPIVALVIMVLGTVATVMTLLSTFLLGVKASIQGVAKLAGLVAVIDKVEAVYQKIAPYVQYLSMYNAKKVENKTPPAA